MNVYMNVSMVDSVKELLSVEMKKVNCSKCGQSMYKYNLPRHMVRVHKGDDINGSNPPSNVSSSVSTRDPSPMGFDRKEDTDVQELSTDKLEYLIQGAINCMLRREVRNDLKTLRAYLAARLPKVPHWVV